MIHTKKLANCPVCPKGENWLGYIVKGEVCSYLCNDCQFIYTWDAKGKLKAPIKYKPAKDTRCGCGGCGR